MTSYTGPRLIVALDFDSESACLELVNQLDPSLCRLKVGKELFVRNGPVLVEKLHAKGFEVFLDLKFHDIPHTVAQAVRAAADLGVWMVNVHACGGEQMLRSAAEALSAVSRPPLLIGVTVLTSMDAKDLSRVGVTASPEQQVVRLASLTKEAGLTGVVCSAAEAPILRAALGDDFVLVTPGIRPENSDAGDQKRVVTPAQAVANGSDYLVVGRPVTRAEDPVTVCRDIARVVAVKQ